MNTVEHAQRIAHLSKLSPEDMLEELLAVIHADGGHYSDEHGLAKAVADAEAKWYDARVEPPGLLDRVKAAEQRVQDNRAPRSIPADPRSDVDLVLAEVCYWLEGKWPPFWITEMQKAKPSINNYSEFPYGC